MINIRAPADSDGVLVTSSVTGGDAWVPRENLGKVLD